MSWTPAGRAYLVALTHYAVLYRQSPVGLPHALSRADGTPALTDVWRYLLDVQE